jgi:hypothetical protein
MVLLYISNGVRYGLSTGKTLQKILFVPLSIPVLLISEQLSFASYNDLTCALAKRFPIVPAINGFDSETCGQEEQLEFTREVDVCIEPGQVTFQSVEKLQINSSFYIRSSKSERK